MCIYSDFIPFAREVLQSFSDFLALCHCTTLHLRSYFWYWLISNADHPRHPRHTNCELCSLLLLRLLNVRPNQSRHQLATKLQWPQLPENVDIQEQRRQRWYWWWPVNFCTARASSCWKKVELMPKPWIHDHRSSQEKKAMIEWLELRAPLQIQIEIQLKLKIKDAE